ncbi:Cadherin domain [Popillia japonica]|uniref:Cadherin domain n=1 Tax=Popillia japonica TaxID=7064 RepID=A0AAW1JZD8_POPJA
MDLLLQCIMGLGHCCFEDVWTAIVLNYLQIMVITFTLTLKRDVQFVTKFYCRIPDTDNQRVIIHVRDVNDEPPYFINRPLPMQAVVQLNAPPNTPVFTLQARDPDTDHNIHYFIVRDRTGGRFEVDERSGVVRTRGTDLFQLDMEYVLYVKAEDQNGRVDERRFQSTPEERLSIVGGKRAPQFYMPSYEAEIPENQKKDSDIISVKAKSFADREIRYTLKAQGQGAGTFNIGPTSGIVKLAKELDFEDLRQPHVYSLVVTATEDSGGFSTSVELTIRVTDVNDNAPKFELPDYQAHNVDEDIPPGTSILKVKAMDADSGANAEIEYLVSDDHFSVDPSGIISNNKQLDADNNNAYYEFVVTAKDKGEPAKTGTATVRVYTKNKNDEEPKFSQQVYTPNVDENAGPNTLVTTVVASDKDGDNVRFGFVGGGTSSGQFVIEEITGVIRLRSREIALEKDKYELNVTAMDDGACCVNGDSTIHTSTAVVVVFITDVNDNKPVFEDCSKYYPKVEEGAPNGSPVIKVHAKDEDKGVNGQVKYSIVQQPNQKGTKFTVDEETGEVSTNKVFDREGDDGKFVSVTVKATDQGEPSLEGVCSFTVEITDVNDNPPLFDRQKYVENVKQDASIGTNILRVSASDEDADNNGAIVYSLNAGSNIQDLEYFEIQPESGWIVLKKPLDRDRYRLRVRASDRGEPPSYADVDVELDVVDRNNKPPLWDMNMYGPIHIKENVTVGTVVTSVKASSGIENNPTVFYRLMPGSTAQTNKFHTFYLQQRPDNGFTWADIKVNHPLDYETIKEYNLTIRVENNGAQQLASEATVYIMLEDVNDEIPLFTEREQETVLEGEPIGTKVTQVNAIDKDGTFPNNQVYYFVVDSPRNEGKDFFEINHSRPGRSSPKSSSIGKSRERTRWKWKPEMVPPQPVPTAIISRIQKCMADLLHNWQNGHGNSKYFARSAWRIYSIIFDHQLLGEQAQTNHAVDAQKSVTNDEMVDKIHDVVLADRRLKLKQQLSQRNPLAICYTKFWSLASAVWPHSIDTPYNNADSTVAHSSLLEHLLWLPTLGISRQSAPRADSTVAHSSLLEHLLWLPTLGISRQSAPRALCALSVESSLHIISNKTSLFTEEIRTDIRT